MFQTYRGHLHADICNILGSFYLRTSDVDEVPRGEGHLESQLGRGARHDRILKLLWVLSDWIPFLRQGYTVLSESRCALRLR